MNEILNKLKKLDCEILSDQKSLIAYSFDNSNFSKLPFAVCLPTNHQQTQQIIQFCYEHNISICPRGKATATTGGAIPTDDLSLVISSEKMNKILDYSIEDQSIRVQTGIINQQVQQHCAEDNLFWAPDPGSMATCSVGGNIACNASGPRGLFYGSVRENVLALKAIDGRGNTFYTGFNCTKYAVGYDLTRLLVGSEGTLAFITEATLKLKSLPKKISLVRLLFEDLYSASKAIVALKNSHFAIQSLEILDHHCLDLVRGNISLNPKAQVLLLAELINFEAIKERTNLEQILFKSLNAKGGLLEIVIGESIEEQVTIRQIRKTLSPAIKAIAENRINEDVVIPISKLTDFFIEIEKIAQKHNLNIVNFGHAGNGNIHCNIMYNKKNKDQRSRANLALEELMHLVIKLKGTISGEHGIGLAKKKLIRQVVDSYTLDLMQKIKSQFDPKNILNPGKIW